MEAQIVTREQKAYLRNAMERVSRSFALVVPWIEQPLDDYFAVAYLICRVVDNIEDCSRPLAWQSARFAELVIMLAEPDSAADVLREWEQFGWPGLSADERALMTVHGGLQLWSIYGSIPESSRTIIQHWSMAMVHGMEESLRHMDAVTSEQGIHLLRTEADYDRYCYAVAGTVGRMGTELIIEQFEIGTRDADELLEGSEACGRALQKTNILKDFLEDLSRKVCFLPDSWLREIDHSPLSLSGAPRGWKEQVFSNILRELRDATDYLCRLPSEAKGYRIASLLCLMPAYETIRNAAHVQTDLYTEGHQIKIKRSTMARLLVQAPIMATDNAAIRAYSTKSEETILTAFR